ncbi:hypothetical protein BM525_18635 (plasmid) [Alteromonas mediterranea]|uniref:DNA topoisomerase n=1 Tax=Alteromonas mediterranea TaxID=314275 RepID=A0AAC9JE73_9ALTE|nr:DNA topoisomerase [Alteromonas mediterranea]APD91899.1 hypothetical protein BM524_18440 [Alteromonas mediterranea]APD99753.1 hypothetical protein BM525_18635 [Alteromonas mediterranea]
MAPFAEVIVCEKPKQAQIFQKALNLKKEYKVGKKSYAWYDKEGGTCVFYERGHILELLPPEHYEPRLKSGWRVDLLPVIVKGSRWPLRVNLKSGGAAQMFKTAKWALVDCGTPHSITIATDNDREGELLGWELLEHLKLADHSNINRVLYSQVTQKKVVEAYNKKQPGSVTFLRYLAGLARQYADWSVGMNVTMGFSAQNKEQIPPYTPLNSGRVIFGISYILYVRHIDMRDFTPQDYYTHKINFGAGKGSAYTGNLIYPEKYVDPKIGKLTNGNVANKIKQAVLNAGKGKVVRCDKEKKETSPPQGFHRTGFDRHMIRRFGMSLEQIANAMQKLYEAGYITYPRVDLKVLDETMHAEMPSYLKAIIKNLRGANQLSESEKNLYERAFKLLDVKRKSKIWKKGVDDGGSHHAIITTEETVPVNSLTSDEFKVYREIADRLLIQFMPNYEYASTIVETQVAGGLISKTSGTSPLKMGWKGLSKDMEEESDEDEVDGKSLPELTLGQVVDVLGVEMSVQTTKSPNYYTEDELLGVLENPKKFVKNKEIIKKLTKLQIGTDGTRQNHVASLDPKGFVKFVKDGKVKRIVPEKKLISVMEVSPDYLSTPETTAYWESAFDDIEKGKLTLETFIQRFRTLEKRFFDDLKQGKFDLKEPITENSRPCKESNENGEPCGGNLFFSKRKNKKTGKSFELWSCARCQASYFNNDGEPGNKLGERGTKGAGEKPEWTPPPNAPKIKCSECKEAYTYHKKLPGKKWSLWECIGCGAAFFDDGGKHGNKMKGK